VFPMETIAWGTRIKRQQTRSSRIGGKSGGLCQPRFMKSSPDRNQVQEVFLALFCMRYTINT